MTEHRLIDCLKPRQLIRYFVCLSLVSLLFLGGGQASAQTSPEKAPLIIASFSFPPLLHLADDDTFSGTMGETVRFICEEAELDCQFVVMPLKRAYNDLKQGRVDGLITLNLGQFNDCCIASEWNAGWSAGLFSTYDMTDIPETPEAMIGQRLIVVNGMRSPYSFLPQLDEWAHDKKITLFKTQNIPSSILMFGHGRADLLWGGEDFKWYLARLAPSKVFNYKPLFKKNVVLWTHKTRTQAHARFNNAYHKLKAEAAIGDNGLLIPYLMNQKYKDYSIN